MSSIPMKPPVHYRILCRYEAGSTALSDTGYVIPTLEAALSKARVLVLDKGQQHIVVKAVAEVNPVPTIVHYEE